MLKARVGAEDPDGRGGGPPGGEHEAGRGKLVAYVCVCVEMFAYGGCRYRHVYVVHVVCVDAYDTVCAYVYVYALWKG